MFKVLIVSYTHTHTQVCGGVEFFSTLTHKSVEVWDFFLHTHTQVCGGVEFFSTLTHQSVEVWGFFPHTGWGGDVCETTMTLPTSDIGWS